MKSFIALLHYPVYNKKKEIISTQITNLDLHDISRIAKTYGIIEFYVSTPFESQRRLANKIREHWTEGFGAKYNEFRKEAFVNTVIVDGLDAIIKRVRSRYKMKPKLIATAAREYDNKIDFYSMREILQTQNGSYLFLFGTGWGLVEEIIERSDYILEPIRGSNHYNHLSVRSAIAIILDRLLGTR
ncbi:MAG TPA: RNA methyltransferase [Nitrospinota bacterium]|nr:RNA methyltransferase [Nitrospinota bacterium]